MGRRARGDVQRSLSIDARRGAPTRALLGEPATREELAVHTLTERPRTRGDCKAGARPCPWAGCAHHLFLDVNPDTGSIKLNYPTVQLEDMEHTCALDLADEGGHTLDEVGIALNITRERVRQIEVAGLRRLHPRALAAGIEAGDIR